MSFREAFSCDHNMITEEFNFYQALPPKMQTELVEFLWHDKLAKFSHFFPFCEEGFRNEIFMQMFSRSYNPGHEIMWEGQRFSKVSFLIQGRINLQQTNGIKFFQLKPGCVIGDYQTIFGLRANFALRTHIE